jgi:hypothetical protein
VTKEDRQKLREAALVAQSGVNARGVAAGARGIGTGIGNLTVWDIQTSNSFRRIGQYGDGDVLCAVTQRSDGHPDLHAAPGVLDYIVAAQPYVVLELLAALDACEEVIAGQVDASKKMHGEIDRMTPTHEIGELIKVRDAVDRMIEAKRKELV